MTDNNKALLTNNAAMLLYGLSAVLIGPTLPGMISSFDLSLSQAGLIGAAQNAGGFFGALFSLWMAERVSHSRAAVLSFARMAVAFTVVVIAFNYMTLLLAFGLTGLFIRVLDVMLNAHTGELSGVNSGSALSRLHLFFSIGALTGPLLTRIILGYGVSWSQLYGSIGLGYLLVVLISARWLRHYVKTGPEEKAPCAPAGEEASPTLASTSSAVGLLGGALLFYAIHQVGISSWLPYFYESSRASGADLASAGLSVYWIGIIIGRFFASWAVKRVGAARFLIFGCIVSSGATLGAVLLPALFLSQLLFLLAGISSGATIPLVFSVGFYLLPSRRGSISAAMSMVMLAGRFAGPWVIGIVADRTNLITAMTIPGMSLLLTALLIAILVTRSRKTQAFSGKTFADRRTDTDHR